MTTALFCCFPTAAASEALLLTLTLPASTVHRLTTGTYKRHGEHSNACEIRCALLTECPARNISAVACCVRDKRLVTVAAPETLGEHV